MSPSVFRESVWYVFFQISCAGNNNIDSDALYQNEGETHTSAQKTEYKMKIFEGSVFTVRESITTGPLLHKNVLIRN